LGCSVRVSKSHLCQDIIPPKVSLTANRYTDCAIPATCMQNIRSRISLYAGDMYCVRSVASEITAGKASQLSEQLTFGVLTARAEQLQNEVLTFCTQ
jgi:hypothetical protein